MKYIFLFVFATLFSSCQFFETEKISSETFYEEEIKTINWNEVDTYPQFNSCKSLTNKEAGKQCFFNRINSEILNTLQQHHFIVHSEVDEKVTVFIEVSEVGSLAINSIEIDSLTALKFPELESWIYESIDGVESPLPALKRGIPVKTTFTLPVILKTD